MLCRLLSLTEDLLIWCAQHSCSLLKYSQKYFSSIQAACKQNRQCLAVMLFLLADSKTYTVKDCCENCKRREGVGPWGNNIRMDYRTQHLLWSLSLCRAGLLNMLPRLLKEYVEVQILHKLNTGPCSGLYFTQLVFQHQSLYLLFLNICAKKTQQFRSEWTIKRFLKFKWAELVTFTEACLNSSISSVESLLFCTKQIFCDQTGIF